MPVLDRTELEASPLADLHAIANQIGLEGFRRFRKADLIDAILGESGGEGSAGKDAEEAEEERPRGRRRRSPRLRRGRADERDEEEKDEDEKDEDAVGVEADAEEDADGASAPAKGSSRRGRSRGGRSEGGRSEGGRSEGGRSEGGRSEGGRSEGGRSEGGRSEGGRSEGGRSEGGRSEGGRSGRSRSEGSRSEGGRSEESEARVAEGVVEVLGNGSAFLRVDPPEPSDDDVYISAAQVRRCELVSGDRVAGPVRTPRRSERYPSLVRIDTINGDSADSVADGARYEDLPVAWPSERIELGSDDKAVEAIDWLTPLGKGSRAVVAGPRGAGKSETLRRVYEAVKGRDGLEVSVVLAGARPEEIADWQDPEPAAAVSFAASADAQAQAVERVLDTARRVAARGGDAFVFIDGLDALAPQSARRALGAARNLREAGSLTILATASAPLGGETTVIVLDPELAASGGEPILDLAASSTLHAELLVGEKDAEAIAKARAKALKDS